MKYMGKVVLEACYCWEYFYDRIENLVDDLIMTHPLKTRLIAEDGLDRFRDAGAFTEDRSYPACICPIG